MTLTALLMLQSAVGGDPLPQGRLRVPGCEAVDAEDIVICGQATTRSRYRLPVIADEQRYAEPRRVLPTKVGIGPSRVRVSPTELPGGAQSDRVMIDFTFGL